MPTLDRPNLVESENLGGGFRRVALEEFITGGFESIYHGEYLYFGKRQLSYFASSSLSPSRTFAAYAADLESGEQGIEDGFHVFIFRAADQQIFRVTPERVYYVGEFKWEWDEAAGHLLLHFNDGRPPEKFLLPSPRHNQAMQRTASKAAIYLLSVCHPPFGYKAPFTGLPVADLVSR